MTIAPPTGPSTRRWTFIRPRTLLLVLVLVVMFIPIRRYTVPSALPVNLEPYRLLIIAVGAGMLLALMVDRRWSIPRLPFGGIFAALVATSLLSIAFNLEPIAEEGLTGTVMGNLLLLLSLVSVFFIVRLLVVDRGHVLTLLRALVVSGALVALAAVIEARLRRNVFDVFLQAVPVLEATRETRAQLRGSALRAISSAQHSIALGALLASLLPVAVWLLWRDGGERGERRWVWAGSTALIGFGIVASVSRTAAVMLLGVVALGLVLRPRVVLSLALLCLPGLLVLYLVLPAPTRALVKSFFPSTGLLAQQQGREGSTRSTGRLADLGPTLDSVAERPLFGRGYGTRVVEGPLTNSPLIDNEYLGRADETGLVGAAPLVLLVAVPMARMWRRASADDSDTADLAAALACSCFAYGISLFFYGAWSYPQEVMVFFMLLAVAAWILTDGPKPDRRRRPAVPLAADRRSDVSTRGPDAMARSA